MKEGRIFLFFVFLSCVLTACSSSTISQRRQSKTEEKILVEGAARCKIYSIYTNLYAKGCKDQIEYEDYKVYVERRHMDGIFFRRYAFIPTFVSDCASKDENSFAVLITDNREMTILRIDDWDH